MFVVWTDVQLLVTYQECLALLDHWLCGFLGDIDIGMVYPCKTLIVWTIYCCKTFNIRRYYNQCIRTAMTVYGRHLDGLWFNVVEEWLQCRSV